MHKRLAIVFGIFAIQLLTSARAAPQEAVPGAEVVSVQRVPMGVMIQERTGALKIEPSSPRSFRIRFSPDGRFAAPRVPTLLPVASIPPFQVNSDGTAVSVRMPQITAVVARSTGSISFVTPDGRTISSEVPGTRDLVPINLPGAYRSRLQFKLMPKEAVYGLGQHQDDFLDHRGSVLQLVQQNREVAIPFAVSTGGYGILWNNPAATQVAVDAEDRKPEGLEDENGVPGGLTARYYVGRNFETLTATRKDPAIDFELVQHAPAGPAA